MALQLNDIYGTETESFRFYRIPQALFEEDLSLEAIMLYSLLLNRVGLSAKNGWTDDRGRVYILFAQTEVQKYLRCGHNRATACMRELEQYGLIERQRQCPGRPVRIFVKNYAAYAESAAGTGSPIPAETASHSPEQAAPAAGNRQCPPPDSGSGHSPERAANHTDPNHTEKNHINPIKPLKPPASPAGDGNERKGKEKERMDLMIRVRRAFKRNIDFDNLVGDCPGDRALFEGYVEMMTEATCLSGETVRLCGRDIPLQDVRQRFLQLERRHVEYVRDCIRRSGRKIGNIRAYTLAALYNAPVTIDQYYDASDLRGEEACRYI